VTRAWLVVLALAACKGKGKGKGDDDCKVVLGDPPHASAEIAKRYPGDGVKVAEVIERCIAPDGDDCERIAAIAKAIPSMMVKTPPHGSGSEYVAACRGMPPEMQRCMLPSYVLAHHAECQDVLTKIRQTAIESIDIRPGAASDRAPNACDAATISIYVSRDGLWLGTGSGTDGRCYAKRRGANLDTDWLERQLVRYQNRDCKPAVEVAPGRDVLYQDVIAVMDVSVKVGLTGVGLTDPGSLLVKLADADPDGARGECKAQVAIAPGKDLQAPPAPLPTSDNPLGDAPVVILTKTDVTLRIDKRDELIGSVAELAKGSGQLADLARELPPKRASNAMVILQADRDTPAGLISRVVMTLKLVGYDSVLFAVKNK
jgi:biopolymer transport protein ExbD